jgi:hypothetical protein
MPRGGARPNTGGTRPGAGRPRTYERVELTKQVTAQLAYFIEDLNLDPRETGFIVSAILNTALTDDRDKWANLFGNRLIKAEPE